MESKYRRVLAMASYPTFNPNISSERLSEFVRNRAITDEYEPGSIFKLITASAALEKKLYFPKRIFRDEWLLYNRWQCHFRCASTWYSDLSSATYQSSNVVYSQVAAKIPHNTFYKYIEISALACLPTLKLPAKQEAIFHHLTI